MQNNIENVFDVCDRNIGIQQETKHNVLEQKRKEKEKEKDENKEGEKEGEKPSLTYQEKKLQTHFNNISNEEVNRWNRMKSRKAKIHELKMLAGIHIEKTIDNEIETSKKKKTWKTMDMCFKWLLVCDYIENLSENITIKDEDIASIRKLVQEKKLDVIYNKSSQCIQSLNYTTLEGHII